MTHKKRKKVKKFLKTGCSFWGPKAAPVIFFFFNFWSSKPWIRIHLKCWFWIRIHNYGIRKSKTSQKRMMLNSFFCGVFQIFIAFPKCLTYIFCYFRSQFSSRWQSPINIASLPYLIVDVIHDLLISDNTLLIAEISQKSMVSKQMSNWAPLFVSFHVYYCSVADPDPDVFGPAGSGSVSTRYGSGSFSNQSTTVRKPLIPTVFWLLYDFLLLKNAVKVALKSIK